MQFQTLQWVMDVNGDGSLSVWELWETARWVFRIPGNLIIEFVGQFPALAALLNVSASPETGYASLNGIAAKALTLLVWVPLLLWVLNRGSTTPRRAQTKKIRTRSLYYWACLTTTRLNTTQAPFSVRLCITR